MNKDYLVMAIITCVSCILLLVFVKKTQIREALVAVLVAQLFSWPVTLIYVLLGLQDNPVRLFPYATDSNFIFAFIFHPTVFTVYYLQYPKQASLTRKISYSTIIITLVIYNQFLIDLYTNLIHHPRKITLLGSWIVIFILYNISRLYIDWFLINTLHLWRTKWWDLKQSY